MIRAALVFNASISTGASTRDFIPPKLTVFAYVHKQEDTELFEESKNYFPLILNKINLTTLFNFSGVNDFNLSVSYLTPTEVGAMLTDIPLVNKLGKALSQWLTPTCADIPEGKLPMQSVFVNGIDTIFLTL